jgi:hypothetical protein
VERELARLAHRSHGVVTRAQLTAAHISLDEIRHRLGTGALIREYPGVYRVGHRAPTLEARYLAAVLACGEHALLSGTAAGHLLGLLRGPAPAPEVTAPTQREVRGLQTRRCRSLTTGDGMRWRGVPVTSVARTLVDLAAKLDEDAVARACHEAGVKHRTTPGQVELVLARRPRSPGAGRLRQILRGDTRVALSRLEARFLELLRAAGLPLPETNRIAGGRRVDCRWPERRLTVEVDGYRDHSSRHAWERDRRREREAYARGDRFRRFTFGDVFEHPEPLLAELRALLT